MLLRRLAAGLAFVTVLLLAAVVFFLHDLDGRARAFLLDGARALEGKIGRPVSIGQVHVTLGWNTAIVARDLAVGPREGAAGDLAVPLVRVAEVRLVVALAPLLRRRALEFMSLEVHQPEVNIVRTPTGLSIDDVRARLSARPPRPPPPDFVLRHLAVRGGALRLHDLGAPPADDLLAEGVSLDAAGIGGAASFRATVSATAFSAAPSSNLTAHLDLAPSPAGFSLTGALVQVRALHLAPLLRWLHARTGPLELGDLALTTDVTVDPPAAQLFASSFQLVAGTTTLRGSFAVHALDRMPVLDVIAAADDPSALAGLLPAGLTARGSCSVWVHATGDADSVEVDLGVNLADLHAGADGPSPARLEARLASSRSAGTLGVSGAVLSYGGLVVQADADLCGLGDAPSLDALWITLSGPAEAAVELIPPARRPRGVTVRGAVRIDLTARGTAGDLRGSLAVDLDAARVGARGFFKPPGAPLSLSLRGALSGGRLDVAHGELRLGALAVAAHGWARDAEHLDMALASSSSVSVASLLRMFPGLEEATRRHGAAGGLLAATGHVRRSGGRTSLELTARLRDGRLRAGKLAVDGVVETRARVDLAAGGISAQAEVDLTRATVGVAPILSKPAGRPARFAVSLAREGQAVHVRDARADWPGVSIEGITLDRDAERLRGSASRVVIALSSLAETMPLRGPPRVLAGAAASFGLQLDSPAADPGAGTLKLSSVELSGPFGRLTGAVEVDASRAVRIDVRSGDLELAGPAGGGGDPGVSFGDARVEAHVHLDTLKVRGQTLRGVDADLALEHGRVDVRTLRAQLLGGSVAIEKSYLDLDDVPELELHAKLEGADLSSFGSARVEGLRGRGSAAFDLRGRGLDAQAMARSLRGAARFEVKDVRAKVTVERKAKLVNPVLGALAERAMQKRPSFVHELDLREGTVVFEVGAGKWKTKAPLVLRTADYDAQLTGALDLDGAFALEGRIEFPPEVVAKASKRRLLPRRPIPLSMRLFGDRTAPKVELLELKETVEALGDALDAANEAEMAEAL